MPTRPHCQDSVATRDGHDRHGRQRFTCGSCGRDFTIRSVSAFSGYRWPADVILMAVRWYLRHPLSATSVMELLSERGIDVSNRTVLRWVQTFGPRLAAEARKHRRLLGRCWYTDEMFFFRRVGRNAGRCLPTGHRGGWRRGRWERSARQCAARARAVSQTRATNATRRAVQSSARSRPEVRARLTLRLGPTAGQDGEHGATLQRRLALHHGDIGHAGGNRGNLRSGHLRM